MEGKWSHWSWDISECRWENIRFQGLGINLSGIVAPSVGIVVPFSLLKALSFGPKFPPSKSTSFFFYVFIFFLKNQTCLQLSHFINLFSACWVLRVQSFLPLHTLSVSFRSRSKLSRTLWISFICSENLLETGILQRSLLKNPISISSFCWNAWIYLWVTC